MHEHDLTSFTRALLRQPSESGTEGPVVEIIRDEMAALGFDAVWLDANGSVVGVVAAYRKPPVSVTIDV